MSTEYVWVSGEEGFGVGVTSLNNLTGAITLAAGSGISLTPAGNTITVASVPASTAPISASQFTATAFTTTATWQDLCQMDITAGTWLVSMNAQFNANGATATRVQFGVSTTSGNSATGLQITQNETINDATTALSDLTNGFSGYIVTLGSTTTHYLKILSNFSVGTPRARGYMVAIRIA